MPAHPLQGVLYKSRIEGVGWWVFVCLIMSLYFSGKTHILFKKVFLETNMGEILKNVVKDHLCHVWIGLAIKAARVD